MLRILLSLLISAAGMLLASCHGPSTQATPNSKSEASQGKTPIQQGVETRDAHLIDSADDLIGTFGTKEGQTITPMVRVSRQGKGYRVENFNDGKWVASDFFAEPLTTDQLRPLGGSHPETYVGIGYRAFLFFRTYPGWSGRGGFKTESGYVLSGAGLFNFEVWRMK